MNQSSTRVPRERICCTYAVFDSDLENWSSNTKVYELPTERCRYVDMFYVVIMVNNISRCDDVFIVEIYLIVLALSAIHHK